MTWISLILAVLKLVNFLIAEGQRQGWIREGEQRQIAKAMAESARKHEETSKILDEVSASSDAAVDQQLRDLEPRS